jgi:hypothetical protein
LCLGGPQPEPVLHPLREEGEGVQEVEEEEEGVLGGRRSKCWPMGVMGGEGGGGGVGGGGGRCGAAGGGGGREGGRGGRGQLGNEGEEQGSKLLQSLRAYPDVIKALPLPGTGVSFAVTSLFLLLLLPLLPLLLLSLRPLNALPLPPAALCPSISNPPFLLLRLLLLFVVVEAQSLPYGHGPPDLRDAIHRRFPLQSPLPEHFQANFDRFEACFSPNKQHLKHVHRLHRAVLLRVFHPFLPVLFQLLCVGGEVEHAGVTFEGGLTRLGIRLNDDVFSQRVQQRLDLAFLEFFQASADSTRPPPAWLFFLPTTAIRTPGMM